MYIHSAGEQERGAIILAGGEGTRLQSLTRTSGCHVPKQYWSPFGTESMLDQTRRRVSLSIGGHRTVTVVNQAHAAFYRPWAEATPGVELVVQSGNRGTAPAILYGLLRLSLRMRDGAVAIFPSDHYISDDQRFMSFVEGAFETVCRYPNRIVLLGIEPEGPEVEYGWIEPGQTMVRTWSSFRRIRAVRRFYEKPSGAVAEDLYGRGCLWNSFVMVAKARTLLEHFTRRLPHLYTAFLRIRAALGTSFEERAAQVLYAGLPAANFSDTVSGGSRFVVLPVTGVHWTDLGSPERLWAAQERIGVNAIAEHAASRTAV